jgi:hypothetical protein
MVVPSGTQRAGWLVENPIHMDDKWGTPCMKTSLLKALLVSSLAAVHGSQMPRPSCLGQALERGGAQGGRYRPMGRGKNPAVW